MHQCTGTAQGYFQGTSLATLADTHGYIVVYPQAPRSGTCWDVATNATLTHNAGGDSLGIASVVRYAIANWGVDATRVYATGTSSGAMMTSVLMGAYPDIFSAGSLYSGVAYGCFEGPSAWNSQCADGDLIQTPQQWVNTSRCLLYSESDQLFRETWSAAAIPGIQDLAPRSNSGTELRAWSYHCYGR